MNKKLNIQSIANDLEGSAFFPSKQQSPIPQKPKVHSTSEETKTKSTKPKAENKDKNLFTDVITSVLQDVNLREWKDTIENTETRGSSLRLTNGEVYAVEDSIKDLERLLKIKTSINELARLGLLFLIHDFKKNNKESLIYKTKKS